MGLCDRAYVSYINRQPFKTYTGTNRARVPLVNGMRPEPEDDAAESVDGILVHMRRLLEDKMVR